MLEKKYGEIYPHLAHIELPTVQTNDTADFTSCDVIFCGLPHGLSQDLVKSIPENVKVIDLSADFRIQNADVYEEWYKRPHTATDIQEMLLKMQRLLPVLVVTRQQH